jgi:hypothetical protein
MPSRIACRRGNSAKATSSSIGSWVATRTPGFVLEGDNNPAPDPWQPKQVDVVGRTWIAVPKVGAVIAWARQPLILGALAASMAVAFVVSRPIKRAREIQGTPERIGVRWGVPPRSPRPT